MLKLPRATDERIALSGQVWNRAAGELERLANVQVAPPLELTDGPAGRRLSVRVKPDRLYWGVVQCTGPIGTEADYSDNRYWIALAYVSNDQTDAPTAPVAVRAYPIGDPRRNVVTATNFFENNDVTHVVRPETIVRLWAEYDRGSPAQLRWSMIVADEGTDRAEPCASSSSGSSSNSISGSSGSSASSSSSSSSSASASGSSSGSGAICPDGYTGVLHVGGAVTRVGDILEQLMIGLHFCDGKLVQTDPPSYLTINLCPLPDCSCSGSSANSGAAGSDSSSSDSSGSSGSNGSTGGGDGGSGSGGSGSGASGGSGGSGSGGSDSSSSSSTGCVDASTATCDGTCDDDSLPACVVADTSALFACQSSCQTMPPTIDLYVGGTCAHSLAALYAGGDSTEQIIAVIEWDADNGCFILLIAGSASADPGCQQIIWQGYGSRPTGVFRRLCGPEGGCDANAGVPTVTVAVCQNSSSSSSSSSSNSNSSASSSSGGCNCDVGACPATITVHTAGIMDCTGAFTMTDYTLNLLGSCDDYDGALYVGSDSNFSLGVEFLGNTVQCWILTVSTQSGSAAELTIDAALQCGYGPAGVYVSTYLQCSGLPSTITISVP